MGILRKKPGSSASQRNSLLMPFATRKTVFVRPLPPSSAISSEKFQLPASNSVEETNPSDSIESEDDSVREEPPITSSEPTVQRFTSTTSENGFLLFPVIPFVPNLELQPVNAENNVIFNLDIADFRAVSSLQDVPPAHETKYCSWNIPENAQLPETFLKLSNMESLVNQSAENMVPNVMITPFAATCSTLNTNNFCSTSSPAIMSSQECHFNPRDIVHDLSFVRNNLEVNSVENPVTNINELPKTLFRPVQYCYPVWIPTKNEKTSSKSLEYLARVGGENFETLLIRTEQENYSCPRKITSDSNGVSSTTENIPCSSNTVELSSPSNFEMLEVVSGRMSETKNFESKCEKRLVNTKWENFTSAAFSSRIPANPSDAINGEGRNTSQNIDANAFKSCNSLTEDSISKYSGNNTRADAKNASERTITLFNIKTGSPFKFKSGSSLPIVSTPDSSVSNESNYGIEYENLAAKLNELTPEMNGLSTKTYNVSKTHGPFSIVPTQNSTWSSSSSSDCKIENKNFEIELNELVGELHNAETSKVPKTHETHSTVSTQEALCHSNRNKNCADENIKTKMSEAFDKLLRDKTAIISEIHDTRSSLTIASQGFVCASSSNEKHETENESLRTELDEMIKKLLFAKTGKISVMHDSQLFSTFPARNIHSLLASNKSCKIEEEGHDSEQIDADFYELMRELLSDKTTGTSEADNTQYFSKVSTENIHCFSSRSTNSTPVAFGSIDEKNDEQNNSLNDDNILRTTKENVSQLSKIPSLWTLHSKDVPSPSADAESPQQVANEKLEKDEILQKSMLCKEENHSLKILDGLLVNDNRTIDIKTENSASIDKASDKYRSTAVKLLTNKNQTIAKLLEPLYKYFEGNKCLICGFESKSSKLYKARQHLITHLSSKSFKCHVCGKLFGWPTGLRRHRETKHGKQLSTTRRQNVLSDANNAEVPKAENLATKHDEEETVNVVTENVVSKHSEEETANHLTENLTTSNISEDTANHLTENLATEHIEKETVSHLTKKLATEYIKAESYNLLSENLTVKHIEEETINHIRKKLNYFIPCIPSSSKAQNKLNSSGNSENSPVISEDETFGNGPEQHDTLLKNAITSDSHDILPESLDQKNSTLFKVKTLSVVESYSNPPSPALPTQNSSYFLSNNKNTEFSDGNLESELDELIKHWLEQNTKNGNVFKGQDTRLFSTVNNHNAFCPPNNSNNWETVDRKLKITKIETNVNERISESLNLKIAENSKEIVAQSFSTVPTHDILCSPNSNKNCGTVNRNSEIVEMDTDMNERVSLSLNNEITENSETHDGQSFLTIPAHDTLSPSRSSEICETIDRNLEMKTSRNLIISESLNADISENSHNEQSFLEVPVSNIHCLSKNISSTIATSGNMDKPLSSKPQNIVRRSHKIASRIRYIPRPRRLLSKDDQRPVDGLPSPVRSLGQDALLPNNAFCDTENQSLNISLGFEVRDNNIKIGESSKFSATTANQFPKQTLVKLLKPLYRELMYKYIRGRKCLLCGFVSKSKGLKGIKRHIVTHLDTKRFNCSVCGKIFDSLPRLKRHRSVHSSFRMSDFYDCKECGQPCFSHSSLKEHQKSHNLVKRYSCSLCGKEYSRLSYLKAHYRADHPGENPIICTICNELFRTSDLLRSHLIRHSVKKPINPFQRHYKKFHLKTLLEKRSKCEFCTKTFNFRSNLAQHLLTHPEARPHVCKACDMRFKHPRHLNRHVEEPSKMFQSISKSED